MIDSVQTWLTQNATWLAPLGVCVALATAFFAFSKQILFGMAWLWNRRLWNSSKIAALQTRVTFVEMPHRMFWHMGRRGTAPAMQIVTEWYATNASDVPVRLLNARLVNPNPTEKHCHATTFMVARDENFAHPGVDMPIAPHDTQVLQASFFLDPPTKKEGKHLMVSLAVMDQYRQEHRTPEVRIDYR